MTRRLGLSYLWVDSFCILQDHEGDKRQVVEAMATIFSKSTVTIRVASASHADAGFLRRDSCPSPVQYHLPFYGPDGTKGSMILQEALYEPNEEPSNKRAWTLQETLLGRRVLTFPSWPHPLQWHCHHGPACDGGHQLDLIGLEVDFEHFGLAILQSLVRLIRPHTDATAARSRLPQEYLKTLELPPVPGDDFEPLPNDKIWRLWCQIVREYTSRRLTYPADKARALAALVDVFRPFYGEHYFAGIWKRHFVRELL